MKLKSKPQAFDVPEFIVTREHFKRYFEKPLPSATFHDKVDEGIILPWSGMKGRYYLNASLRRMGLSSVSRLPSDSANPRSSEDLVRLAFTIIDRDLFQAPSWLLGVEVIEAAETLPLRDKNHRHPSSPAPIPFSGGLTVLLVGFQGIFWREKGWRSRY